MTEIIKLAEELGKKIKEDKITKALFAAQEAYEKDDNINRLYTEYTVQQKALTMEFAKEEQDEQFVAAIEKRIRELTDKISSHPVYIAYLEAENDYNDLMQLVNDEINFQITGKRTCAGDCSACGGCSSKE